MTSDGQANARGVAVAILAACLAAVLIFLALGRAGAGPVDDDYIVYRYARNWLEEGRLAFNLVGPGSVPQESEGYTSPLWLACCVGAEAVRLAPERFSPALGLIGWLVAVATTSLAVRALATGAATLSVLLAALLIAVSPAAAWHAHAGLGTLPLAGAIGAALWAASTRRGVVFAAASVAAVLLRLEAIAVLVPLALLFGRESGERRSAGPVLAAALVPITAAALIVAVRFTMFERLFPATFHTKTLPLGDELGYGATYLIRSVGEGGLGLLGLAAVVGLGGTLAQRSLALASLGGLSAVVLSGGDWVVFARFLVPFSPVFGAGAVLWCASLGSLPARAALAVAALSVTVFGFRGDVMAQALFEVRFFEAHWRSVGDAIAEGTGDDASLALSPIGAIGYRSRRPVIDVLGLTHAAFHGLPPDVGGVGVKGHHRHDGAWVLDQRPTYLLLGNVTLQPETESLDVNPWEADIVADPRFRADYEAETLWIDAPDGSRRAAPYFRRKEAPPIQTSH